MAIDVTTLALAQAYARNLLGGGATAGKNVTIESIVAIDGGNRITFGYTDNDGVARTKTLDVMDGKDGADGKNGTNGTNGKDGTSATHSWNGTVLSITSASGTSSADLKGAKGDKGDKGNKGDKGDKGDKPVKGTDYWTDADQLAILQDVESMLNGLPVFGVVDDNNKITITSALGNGTYSLMYENEDGTLTEVGTITVGSEGAPAYINLFDPAFATLNQRWSNSSYAFTTSNGSCHVVSDYIAIPDISDSGLEHILRFRGGNWAGNAGIIYYNSSKGVLQASDASSNGVGVTVASDTPTTDENGDRQITLGHKNGAYDSKWASAAFIRITLQINSTSTAITADDIQNIIITIDEPIVD